MRLDVKKTAILCGVSSSMILLLFTMCRIKKRGATGEKNIISKFYIGYNQSISGSVIGAIWAFVDGFISGAVIAWICNLISKNNRLK